MDPFYRDCYTTPYNIQLLKAFGSKVKVETFNGSIMDKESEHACENDDKMERMICHKEVSEAEACSLFDKSIERTASSTSTEYINAQPSRKVYFKKVKNETEETYRIEGSNDFYEKQRSLIDKYFSRENGPNVTLAEFSLFYQPVPADESKKLFPLFKNPNAKIHDSTIKSAFLSSEYLPEIIITSKGRVVLEVFKS